MKKGIILDFDGLVVDTEMMWFEIYKEWFDNKYNYNLTESEFVTCVGSTSHKMFAEISEKVGKVILVDDFLDECQDTFIKRSTDITFMPGVINFINDAFHKGFQIAIATSSNKNHLERLIGSHNILTKINHIVTRDDVEKVKPHPDLFLKAASLLNLEKEEIVIFEDSKNGYIAGLNANIEVIVIPNNITKHAVFPKEAVKLENILDYSLNKVFNPF